MDRGFKDEKEINQLIKATKADQETPITRYEIEG